MKNQEINDYNLRQIVLIQHSVKEYKNNKISTKHFIDDIDILIGLQRSNVYYGK